MMFRSEQKNESQTETFQSKSRSFLLPFNMTLICHTTISFVRSFFKNILNFVEFSLGRYLYVAFLFNFTDNFVCLFFLLLFTQNFYTILFLLRLNKHSQIAAEFSQLIILPFVFFSSAKFFQRYLL